MKYPIAMHYDPFLGEVEREMTPTEYTERVDWFKNYIKVHENDSPRRIKEYMNYLRHWFSNEVCNGFSDFETRLAMHALPMSFNIYFN